MPKEDRLKIIKSLNIKNEFVINRVFINAPKERKKDFYDVKG